MVISDTVSEAPPNRNIVYPTEAQGLLLRNAIDIDDGVSCCLDAMRAYSLAGSPDEMAIPGEIARLGEWLRTHGHGDVAYASARALAAYVASAIQDGMPREKLARHVAFLRRFYGCIRRQGLRADDPMVDVRIYGMFGGPSQRY